jgi:hypothetical protein
MTPTLRPHKNKITGSIGPEKGIGKKLKKTIGKAAMENIGNGTANKKKKGRVFIPRFVISFG